MPTERLTITVEDAAALLGISRGLAYDLVRRGEIPALRLGGRIVVPKRRLQEMVDGQHRDGAGGDGAASA